MPFRRFQSFRRLLRAMLRSLACGSLSPARPFASGVELSGQSRVHATLLVVLGMLVVWHEMQGSHGVTLLPFVEDLEPVPFVEELSMPVTALPADLLGAVAGDPAEPCQTLLTLAPAPSLLAGRDCRNPLPDRRIHFVRSAGGDGRPRRRRVRRAHQDGSARLIGQRGGTPASEDAVARTSLDCRT